MDTTVTLPLGQMGIETKEFTDEELMGRIRNGDRDAFSELVMRHTKKYYSLAYRMLSSREEAEDIVQESFLILWTNPASWDSGRQAKFTTWFYRVVWNACIDMEEEEHAPLPMEDGYDPPGRGPGGRRSARNETEQGEHRRVHRGAAGITADGSRALLLRRGEQQGGSRDNGGEREGARVASHARENFAQEQAWRR